MRTETPQSQTLLTSIPWVNENTGDIYCSETCARKDNRKAGGELHQTKLTADMRGLHCDRCAKEI